MIAIYSQNQEVINAQVYNALNINYSVQGTFSDSGRKIANFLADANIFIDCGKMNMDVYKIVFDFSMILQEHYFSLFLTLRHSLNVLLVQIRDNLDICNYAPELNLIIKNKYETYMQTSVPQISQDVQRI